MYNNKELIARAIVEDNLQHLLLKPSLSLFIHIISQYFCYIQSPLAKSKCFIWNFQVVQLDQLLIYISFDDTTQEHFRSNKLPDFILPLKYPCTLQLVFQAFSAQYMFTELAWLTE